MINNVHELGEHKAYATMARRTHDFRSVKANEVAEYEADGWEVSKKNKQNTRMTKHKSHSSRLEDRVWSLFWRMGFTHLSGRRGAQLDVKPKDSSGPTNQLDVVALDSEVALAVECKSVSKPRKESRFQEILAKHAAIRERFVNAVNSQFPAEHKRICALTVVTSNIVLSSNDIERAGEQKISLINESDLSYYEKLVDHLGPAAKYQFFADILPTRSIRGLSIAVPALESKMGGNNCYTFSIRPEYLLKIAYVSHRLKGKATDIDTYQRMIKKARLKRIRDYISADGIFPTNIVVSLETTKKSAFRFEPKETTGYEGARYGTIHLSPSYKSAWIIDGQHRLFAYSGHGRAKTSHISVLAFLNLPASQQAQLFIDINHEQKSVKRSLLQELYAELNWDAEDEDKRVGAIVSKTIQVLNEDLDSPFYERIQLTDDKRTSVRCISLASIFSALQQSNLFVIKKGVEYGALWTEKNSTTVKRASHIVEAWFTFVTKADSGNWWDAGSGEGGGLAMNDGVVVCLDVLKAVSQHLQAKGMHLIALSDCELADELEPYGTKLGEYFGNFSHEQREAFRKNSRGNQGKTASRQRCEEALHGSFPDFDPPGLQNYLEAQATNNNEAAYAIINRLERKIEEIIITALKAEFGEDGDEAWWYNGVKEPVREKAVGAREKAKGRGTREEYLYLSDFRNIALENWNLFQDLLSIGPKGNKKKRTEWIAKLNNMRNIVMHPAKRQIITTEQLEDLKRWERHLSGVESDDQTDA